MADTVDSCTAPQTPDTAPSSSKPTTPPQTYTWNDAYAQNQTPVFNKVAGQDRFSVDDEIRKMNNQYLRVTDETQGHYLVGMDPEEFMETFMPWNADTPAAYRKKSIPEERLRDLHSMASKKHEKDMYSAFVRSSVSFREIMLYTYCSIDSRFPRLADYREEGSSWRQRYRHQVWRISETRRRVSKRCRRHGALYRG